MLMLHKDAEGVSCEQLQDLPVPYATATWQPIGHGQFDQIVRGELAGAGIQVTQAHYGLSEPDEDGFRHRLFGVYHTLDAIVPGEVAAMVGFRNSTDQSLSAGLVFGSRVFVCDNLAFSGEYILKRRHTKHILDDLPGLIAQGVSRFEHHVQFQRRLFERLRTAPLNDAEAHDLMVRGADAGVISYTGIRTVRKEWVTPSHEAFRERTAWSLFNAFTEAAKGYSPLALSGRTLMLTDLFRRTFYAEEVRHDAA